MKVKRKILKKKMSACGCPGLPGPSGTAGTRTILTDVSVTWEQLCAMEEGATLCDWTEDGVRCLIKRGPASICAYLGIPIGHPMAGHDYESIPISVHGGLTFAKEGDGKYFPNGFYFYGWDYSHCGDYSFYYNNISTIRNEDKKWLLGEVQQQVKNAVYDFKKLMELAEKAAKHLWIDMSELKSESENS